MEPIDYRGALGRGWRLLVILGIIGLAVGLLLPPNGKSSQWVTYSNVGALPADVTTSSPLTPGVSTDQILFYASTDQVAAVAGVLASVNEPVSVLRTMVTVTGPGTSSSGSNSGQPGVVVVEVKAPSSAESVKFNNAFDQALTLQIQGSADTQLQAQQSEVKKSIATIQTQLQGLTDQAGVTATALESELNTLETHQAQLAVTTAYTGFTVLQSAQGALKSAAPLADSRPVRGLFGLLIGVFLGAVVALAVSMLDKRLRSAVRAEAAFGYPVVAEIPDGSIPSTETYRMLRLPVFREPLARPVAADDGWAGSTELVYDRLDLVPVVALSNRGLQPAPVPALDLPSGPVGRRVVLVASPGTEPTRAFVAANLATACAESGQRVAVVSTGDIPADEDSPHRPVTTVLTRDVEAMLEDTSVPGVSTLALQRLVARPSQLVATAPDVIAALLGIVDVVIVEVPPFLTVHHGEGLVPLVDAVLVVGESKFTTSDQVRRTGAVLRRLEAPVAGLVLTNVPVPAGDPRRSPASSSAAADEPLDDQVGVDGDRDDGERDRAPGPDGGPMTFFAANPVVRPVDGDDADRRGA